MANLLLSSDLSQNIKEYITDLCKELKNDGKYSGLGIIRLGENPSDIAYEKSIEKYAASVGVDTFFYEEDPNISEDDFVELIEEVNEDERIDGILIFKPLPDHLNSDLLKEIIIPLKDIDGISGTSMSLLYDTPIEHGEEILPSWLGSGFPPCTAEACMLILDAYDINPAGKRAVVVGRSDVIGKPISLMLLNRDATVTICHSKTQNLSEITKEADILIVATGKKEGIGAEYVSEGQTVIDVGIHMNEDGSMCGDVNFKEVEPIVENITPVPGGVGGLTTALLVKHVVDSSMRMLIIDNEIYMDDYEDEFYGDISNEDGPLDDGMEIKGKVIKFNRPEED